MENYIKPRGPIGEEINIAPLRFRTQEDIRNELAARQQAAQIAAGLAVSIATAAELSTVQ